VPTHPTDSAKKTPSNHLNRQAGVYSLAAAAAGVSMLALAQPAAGEVVVTKKTIPIPLAPNFQNPVKISMANNGVDNFSFILSGNSATGGSIILLGGGVFPEGNGNQVLIGGTFYGEALALPRGAKIGPAPSFASSIPLVEGANSTRSRGFWGGDLKNHYLGVRFLISGETHYGWIRLTVTTSVQMRKPSMSATITGYAYETVANKPILAGTAEKPTAEVHVPESLQQQAGPSLGMLALGADGLPLWRREETLTSR
jgi:hypothetical protein